MLADTVNKSSNLVEHIFLISVEAADWVNIDALTNHLADACRFMEGVGVTDVCYQGLMGEVEDEAEDFQTL